MILSAHIASKLLKSTGELALLRVLTLISTSGVAIGVAMLVVVLSVFNGFFTVVQDLMLTWDPDIRIERTDGSYFEQEELSQLLELEADIVEWYPFIEGKALMNGAQKDDKVVIVRGVDIDRFFQLQSIQNNLEAGSMQVNYQNGRLGILVGRSLAYDMGLRVKDQVRLVSAAGMKKRLTQFAAPRSAPFEIRGIFKMQDLFEGSVIFTDLAYASRLFETKGAVSAADLRITKRDEAERIKAKLNDLLPDHFVVKTWYDLQKPIYDVMKLEKWASYFLLMIIVFVAVLNIVGSMSMIVIRKRKDIAVLRTLGLAKSEIQRIFLWQGLRIGLTGASSGLVLGLFGAWIQLKYKLIKLSDAFIIDAYPIQIVWTDVLLICSGAIIFCVLASIYPSRKASTMPVAESLA